MKLLSILLYKWNSDKPVLLSSCYNLNDFNFFQRKAMQEHILFHSRLLCSRVEAGNRVTVSFPQDLGHCHIYVTDNGYGICCITSPDYPVRCAFSLLTQYLQVYLENQNSNTDPLLANKDCNETLTQCEELFNKYQDPLNNDRIFKVQKDLDEVRDVMLKNIDDLLHRGETLDTLMQKSSDLSAASYQFYRTAKKNNQCCQLY
ncbi:hypothetical protein ACR3K2_09240 [Cryptosporidium serpentis]